MATRQRLIISGREATHNPTEEQQILSRKASNGEGTVISPFMILFHKTVFSAALHHEGTNAGTEQTSSNGQKYKTSSTVKARLTISVRIGRYDLLSELNLNISP